MFLVRNTVHVRCYVQEMNDIPYKTCTRDIRYCVQEIYDITYKRCTIFRIQDMYDVTYKGCTILRIQDMYDVTYKGCNISSNSLKKRGGMNTSRQTVKYNSIIVTVSALRWSNKLFHVSSWTHTDGIITIIQWFAINVMIVCSLDVYL